jgi:hypothetical protein
VNVNEAGQLLAAAAAFDNRQPSRAAAQAWAAALHDVPLDDDALAAVARYYGTDDPQASGQRWIQPHHVRAHRKVIRGERIGPAGPGASIPAPPPELTDDPKAYAKAIKEITARIADGRMPFRAIEGGRGRRGPPPAFKAARPSEDNDRVLAQTITCPVEWCPALVGEPCRSGPDMPPMKRWHPSRLTNAQEAS